MYAPSVFTMSASSTPSTWLFVPEYAAEPADSAAGPVVPSIRASPKIHGQDTGEARRWALSASREGKCLSNPQSRSGIVNWRGAPPAGPGLGEVAALVSIAPADPDSMLYHVPNLHLVPLLGEAMGIPIVQERADRGEDAELAALRKALGPLEIDGVVVGAIASDYQHSRVNQVADDLGIRVFAPSWRRDPRQ